MHNVLDFLQFEDGWFYLHTPGLLHWHWGSHTVKQPWRIRVNALTPPRTDDITMTKQSTTKSHAYFMGWALSTLFQMDKLSSGLAFLHRNGMKCVLLHGESPDKNVTSHVTCRVSMVHKGFWSMQDCSISIAWWRHQMETFSALLAICVASSRWIPRTKASDEELWCFLWSTPK